MVNREYINELKDDNKLKTVIESEKSKYRSEDVVFCYPKYNISDNEVPDILKQNGTKINREFLFVRVEYDDNLKKCVYIDTRIDRKINLDSISRGGSYGKNIDMKDIVLVMSTPDYIKAKEVSDKIMSLPRNERDLYANQISDKDNNLAFAYFNYINSEERSKPYFFAHEAHHSETNAKIEQREKEVGYGKLNIEDYYKSCEDSEKSAYFSEVLKVIENYHKGNNYDDFKAFPGTRYNWLKDKLRDTSVDKRKDLVMDFTNLLKVSNNNWKQEISAFYYDEGSQFEAKTKDYIDQNRGKVGSKESSEEYKLYKSIQYSYKIYNPDTKTYENKDLSDCVQDIDINKRAKSFALRMKVEERKKDINNNGENTDFFISEEKTQEKKPSTIGILKSIFYKKKREGM